MFNETILQKFNHNFISCDATMELIEDYIGYSKLIFLDNENNYTIVNEHLGKWDGKCWFSNETYKDVSYKDFGGKKIPTKTATGFGYGRTFETYDWRTESWTKKTDTKYNDFRDYEDFYDDDEKDAETRIGDTYEYDEVCECCIEEKSVLMYDNTYQSYMCEDCTKDICADTYKITDWDFELLEKDDDIVPF
jgi:hypothetical protein